jgi:Domain of unknown function (DUF4157)
MPGAMTLQPTARRATRPAAGRMRPSRAAALDPNRSAADARGLHDIAEAGLVGAPVPYPHGERIARAFGRYAPAGLRAHLGPSPAPDRPDHVAAAPIQMSAPARARAAAGAAAALRAMFGTHPAKAGPRGVHINDDAALEREAHAMGAKALAVRQPNPAPPPNRTGLPDRLKAGVENLSGLSLDRVTVHYDSDKPAQLQARAYAQGNEIHVAPGEEKHLPHEAWHVVQQTQGRVKPTMRMTAAQAPRLNSDVPASGQLRELSPAGPPGQVVQRIKLTEKDVGKHFIVGKHRRVMKLLSYDGGRGTFELPSGATVSINEDQVVEQFSPFRSQSYEGLDFQHSHYPQSILGSKTSGGRHDRRRFMSNLNITFEGQGMQEDNPLETHLGLRKGLGTGKSRGSENQVNAGIGLIIRSKLGQYVVRYRIPKTFTSGAKNLDVAKLINLLLKYGIIESPDDYQPELYSHSEQEMILYLDENVETLADHLVKLAGTSGGSVVGVMLDLASIPNTVCNECHKTLESLFSPGGGWMRSFLATLSFNGLFTGPNVQTIIRASAENVFKGAQTQYGEALKHSKFESNIDVTGKKPGPAFLELVTPLDKFSEDRELLISKLLSKAKGTLGGKELKIGDEVSIKERLGKSAGPELKGTKFSYGDRRFEITKAEDGVSVKLTGIEVPSNLEQLVKNEFGSVVEIRGDTMACYIRSIITGLAEPYGLLAQDQIENFVGAVEDHLEELGLRFRGETIDAGGLAAANVRDAIQQLVPGAPDVSINIVQWSPRAGQLTSFTANVGAVPITLLYTPGHFDLVDTRNRGNNDSNEVRSKKRKTEVK